MSVSLELALESIIGGEREEWTPQQLRGLADFLEGEDGMVTVTIGIGFDLQKEFAYSVDHDYHRAIARRNARRTLGLPVDEEDEAFIKAADVESTKRLERRREYEAAAEKRLRAAMERRANAN